MRFTDHDADQRQRRQARQNGAQAWHLQIADVQLAKLSVRGEQNEHGSGGGQRQHMLMVLGSFLAVLGLGQGAVVISGGLDLSIPWTVTITG